MRSLCVFLTVPILLCGCSAVRSPETLAASVKEGYGAASVIETDAVLHTASKAGFDDYKVHVVYRNGEHPTADITLTAPEALEGITAHIDGDSGSLIYEDTAVQTTLPDHRGAAPMDAVPAIFDTLCSADADSVWMDGDKLTLEYIEHGEEGTLTREISLDPENGAPEQANLSWNGTQTIGVSFSGFTMNHSE